MALEVLILVCCICSFCLSVLACALIMPLPKESPSGIDDFKQVASGRVIYDTEKTPVKGDAQQCAYNCSLDWTCKGFTTWSVKDSFGFVESKCIKTTSNVNPWMTVPGYLVGKPSANIFVKTS